MLVDLSARLRRPSPISGSLALGVAAAMALAGCSSEAASEPAAPVGVNDVAKACAISAGWSKFASNSCIVCRSSSRVQRCDCSHDDFSGKCESAQKALLAEPSCDGADGCAARCTQGDCACVEACYAAPACRKVAAARDGCVTEVCDAICK